MYAIVIRSRMTEARQIIPIVSIAQLQYDIHPRAQESRYALITIMVYDSVFISFEEIIMLADVRRTKNVYPNITHTYEG